jgi:hypothetical protein
MHFSSLLRDSLIQPTSNFGFRYKRQPETWPCNEITNPKSGSVPKQPLQILTEVFNTPVPYLEAQVSILVPLSFRYNQVLLYGS